MRLSQTPPSGAGRVRHTTKTEQLITIINNLGSDPYGNPLGIRTKALAEASGVPANSIPVLLATAVDKGLICACKVTSPNSRAQNEYRAGGGMPPPPFQPLNLKRRDVALRRTETTPQQPQPEVGNNTGSTDTVLSPTTPSAGVRAATAAEATPKPEAPARMHTVPAASKASAGDATAPDALNIITLDADGTLILGTAEATLELPIDQVLRLGDFLHATEGVWRP